MITAALIGNPNVGKTTLFNLLTASNQYVGNWPGVTVEKREGILNKNIKIVDLPGIYAMDTYSNEEKVSKEFLQKEKVDLIINIVDGSNLFRNLYLTLQLKEFKIPILLVINMIDTAESKGITFDSNKLAQSLNIDILAISAAKNKGVDKVIDYLSKGNFRSDGLENPYKFSTEEESYKYIEKILDLSVKKEEGNGSTVTDLIDNLVLNNWLAYPIFIFMMILIFKFTFSWVGQPLADLLDIGLNDHLVPWVRGFLATSSPWFQSLILDGIIGGVGSVVVFLPIILTLFLGISLLEESGYMARGAFIMDKLMRKMGLSGKAFIPMIVGFGCTVPAIMSARTLESEKDRKLAALLAPMMSCNARLPVYALFASVFFSGKETIVVGSLYLLGVVMAFIIGILFKNTLFKKDEEPFIIELPEYRIPTFKNVASNTWEKGKGFLKKAGTLIFSVSVIVWFLSNFNLKGMTEIENSLLATIGKFISPFFQPLGFGEWQASVALLTGLMAKEAVLGTMGAIYGSNLEQLLLGHFTHISAYSFLLFVLLYTPCISAVATMKKEYGTKLMTFSIIYQIGLAWIISFIFYNIANLII